MLSVFANYLWTWLSGLFQSATNALGSILQSVVNAIGSLLNTLFQPIFAIINAFFYFISSLFTLIGLLFQLLVQVFHVMFSFIQGLFVTITGLTNYAGAAQSLPSGVSSVFAHFSTVMVDLQLDNVAWVLDAGIWIFTAFSVVRIISNFGVAGGDE